MMLINAADRDGDGTLDFEEFVRIMMGWRAAAAVDDCNEIIDESDTFDIFLIWFISDESCPVWSNVHQPYNKIFNSGLERFVIY